MESLHKIPSRSQSHRQRHLRRADKIGVEFRNQSETDAGTKRISEPKDRIRTRGTLDMRICSGAAEARFT